MSVFVTGGSGFLGQHLLRTYVQAGVPVKALARSAAAAGVVRAAGAEPVPGHVGDAASMRAGMIGCEQVVHCAALADQWGPRERFDAVNVTGTAYVLAAARASGVARVVHVSTEAVLADGKPLRNVDESAPRPAHPVGNYAITKGLAEDLVTAANGGDFTTVVVRPRFIWGPGDTTVLPAVLAAARGNRFAWIDGGRYQTSTCHVSNVCAGILAAAERGVGGGIYFLTDGPPVEFRSFLTELAATAGVPLGDRSIPHPVAWAGASVLEEAWRLLRLRSEPPLTRTFLALSGQEMTVDDSRARAEIGYRPVVERAVGLATLATRP
jgi:nucleoside-diphosphate-sugar epimerase